MNLAYFRIVWAIGSRQITRVVRKPQMLTPIFLVPTMFLVVTSGGAARAIDLPGFPQVDSFFQFALAGAIIQSTMLGGLMTGIALSVDVDNGFFDRMIVAPIPRSALVLGRVLGTAVIALFQAILYLALGVAFGAPIEGGVLGVLIILMLAALSSASLGGLAVALSLRAQAQWVQGMFPLVFVIIFLSSAFFPRELLTGPAEAVASYNPISYLAEGIRGPIIAGNSGSVELKAFAVGIGMAVFTSLIAVLALRVRLGGSR
ncbi:MAG: ABC transporter permease [Thermoleophilaceae bacterium]|nr:ABC transporter permease [Thermoleophilaceae bacterium]